MPVEKFFVWMIMRRYKTTESVGIESFTVKLAEPRLVDYENVDVVCIILVGQGGRKEGGGGELP
jgi:hypothetical protein